MAPEAQLYLQRNGLAVGGPFFSLEKEAQADGSSHPSALWRLGWSTPTLVLAPRTLRLIA